MAVSELFDAAVWVPSAVAEAFTGVTAHRSPDGDAFLQQRASDGSGHLHNS